MSDQNGNGAVPPPASRGEPMMPVPMTIYVPAGMKNNHIEVLCTPTTRMGIVRPRRPVPMQFNSVPIDFLMQTFVGMCKSGQIRRRVRGADGEFVKDDEGKFLLETFDDFYDVGPPPQPPEEQPPPSRILTV